MRHPFKTILFLLPLLFAQAAYGDLNSDLIEAAEAGDTAKVEKLLEQGADVNAKDKYGMTPLMVAAIEGHTETVKALLDAGADVDAKDKDGVTALVIAALEGHTEIVEILIGKGADVNVKVDIVGGTTTALIEAAFGGHTETVKALIAGGADVNAKDKYGQTTLMVAAFSGHTEIVELLIGKGADVNAKRKDGVTALMGAESKGHTEIVEILIGKGADVNAKTIDGKIDLMYVDSKGRTEEKPLRSGLVHDQRGLVKPKRIHYVKPEYPEAAKRVALEGHVILQVTVDERGNVADVIVVQEGPLGMTEKAVEAVWKWKYEPFTFHGKPIRLSFTKIVRFTLPEAESKDRAEDEKILKQAGAEE